MTNTESSGEIYIKCEPVSDVESGIEIEQVNQIRLFNFGSTPSGDESASEMKKRLKNQEKRTRSILWSLVLSIALIFYIKYCFDIYNGVKQANYVFMSTFTLLIIVLIIISSLIFSGVM